MLRSLDVADATCRTAVWGVAVPQRCLSSCREALRVFPGQVPDAFQWRNLPLIVCSPMSPTCRVLTELVSKMKDMQMDKSELGCLRAIVLFNPGKCEAGDSPR